MGQRYEKSVKYAKLNALFNFWTYAVFPNEREAFKS